MLHHRKTKATVGNPLSNTSKNRRRQNGGSFSPLVLTLGLAGASLLAVFWMLGAVHRTSASLATNGNSSSDSTSVHRSVLSNPPDAFAKVRETFYDRYGGTTTARSMLQRGVKRYGSLEQTAHRMLAAVAAGTPLRLSFGGYSVTVGRGNRLEQSYPKVLESLLQPVLQSTLGLDVTTVNAAIGGIPSFPYGWCMDHFLGANSDAVSWDYSMNEGKGAAVFEAYLRQAWAQMPDRHPMVIVLDTNKDRCSLLQSYADDGWLADAVCVGMAKYAVPDLKKVLSGPADKLPAGFRDWEEFGAPSGCPGRSSWHPKRQEHALIAWMLAMYFVDAAELAYTITQKNPKWKSEYMGYKPTSLAYTAPLEPPPKNSQAVTELLYGHEDGSSYHMKQLSCRTNFLPATDSRSVLSSIVVSGLSPTASAENIIETRDDAAYAAGWVLDISSTERDTKIKVNKCGGLGYVDMKIALYGIPESGPLRLWLPMEAHSKHHDHDHDDHSEDDLEADHWFDELIICEANEKRGGKACKLDADMEYTVGGVVVDAPTMIVGAGEYLKRKTCVHVGVPNGAKITKLHDVQTLDGSAASADARRQLAESDKAVGLIVDIRAKGAVTRKDGACCVSHVVWEQH